MTHITDRAKLRELIQAATPGEWRLGWENTVASQPSEWNTIPLASGWASDAWIKEDATDESKANAACIVAIHNALPALLDEADAREAEIADLKGCVMAFGGVWAVQYAKDCGLPDGHLSPSHYDILERCGARMNDFTRAALTESARHD